MATKAELLEIARQAMEEGDEATAQAVMDDIEKMESKPSAKPKEEEKTGILSALGTGFKRGLEQAAVGVTQRIMGGLSSYHQSQVDDFEKGLASGEIPNTQENISKLNEMKSQVAAETKGGELLSGYEQQARQEFAPTQEDRPLASFIGNMGGQIAGLPVPGLSQANLLMKTGQSALQGAALGYAQPTVEGEDAGSNAGVGALIGGAIPLALKPIAAGAGALYRGATGQASDDVAAAVNYADQNNLPLTTTDLMPSNTFATKAAQQLGEKIPFVGTGRLRSRQQEARIGEMKRLADEYGVPSDTEIVASLNRKADKLSAAAAKRYDTTINAMGDTPIPLTNTVAAIEKQIDKYTRPGSSVPAAEINALKRLRADLTSGDNSLELLRQNRTLLREGLKGDSVSMSDTAARMHADVYRGMTQDMADGVASKLGPKAAADLKQVDAIWAREVSATKNTKLKSIFEKGDITPEKATKMLFSSPKSELQILHNALDKTGRDNARAAIISQAFSKAKESPDRFINEMDRLKDQSSVFFRGEDKKILDGALNYLKYTAQASKSAVTTKSGQELIAPSAIAGVIADVKLTGGVTTAAIGSLGAAARLYETKPIRNLMIRMANVPPNSTAFEKTANLLSDEISKNAARINTPDQEESNDEQIRKPYN